MLNLISSKEFCGLWQAYTTLLLIHLNIFSTNALRHWKSKNALERDSTTALYRPYSDVQSRPLHHFSSSYFLLYSSIQHLWRPRRWQSSLSPISFRNTPLLLSKYSNLGVHASVVFIGHSRRVSDYEETGGQHATFTYQVSKESVFAT